MQQVSWCDPKVLKIIVALVARCGESPVSQAFKDAWQAEDWDRLVSLDCDPTMYDSAANYFADRQLLAFIGKLDCIPTTFNRAEAAVTKWWEAERQCYRTNESIWSLTADECLNPFVRKVQARIARVIGHKPPDDLIGRHGPGSTFADRRGPTPLDKMSSAPTLTRDAWPHLVVFFGNQWGHCCALEGREPVFVRGNRHVTVRKNSKTDRSIAIEPSINIFYQLAIGGILRRRFKLVAGMCLDHGQTYHREMARRGSFTGSLCTIDLSSASDTLALEVVRLLLPPAWVELLESLRSTHTLIGEKWVRLEKFSSMGNGYTFELESLIFWALAAEAAKEVMGIEPVAYDTIAVYGDDIIVRSECSRAVIAVLRRFGFTLNDKKSFTKGPFRESCGGDFFEGVEVTPFKLKDMPNDPSSWITVANGLRRVAEPFGGLQWDVHFLRAWRVCLDALPNGIRRCRGPSDLGDVVIHDDDSQRWEIKVRNGRRYVRAYVGKQLPNVAIDGYSPSVILAGATLGVATSRGCSVMLGRENPGIGLITRKTDMSYRLRWIQRN